MDTPSLIFYEHNLDDSQVKSLSKSVLNLGNECRALAEENARLKAEVERMTKTGDAMADLIAYELRIDEGQELPESVKHWNAAKEGKSV